MDNTVYDILETRLKNDMDKNIGKLGIRTQCIYIDADEDFTITIELVSQDDNGVVLASTF